MKKYCLRGHDRTLPGGLRVNGSCKKCKKEHNKAYFKNWYKQRPKTYIEYRWRNGKIKLRGDEYARLQQTTACEICQRPKTDFKLALALDHDHKTGKSRGFVCIPCNRGILKIVEDSPELISKAQVYLDKWTQENNKLEEIK